MTKIMAFFVLGLKKTGKDFFHLSTAFEPRKRRDHPVIVSHLL